MGHEREADFYNANLERFLIPLESSPWRDVYERAAAFVPPGAGPIADLGCGTGRFARLLRARGTAAYWGVDFADERVAEARRYVPECEFTVGSVFDEAIQRRFGEFKVFVLLEILEHLERDVELIAAVPPGALVVLSVPNFDSAAHVRLFEDQADVVKRYGALLDFEAGERHVYERPLAKAARLRGRKRKRIFVFSARRRLPHPHEE